MNHARVTAWAAVALLATGCSSAEGPAPGSPGVASVQGGPSELEKGQAVLAEAHAEIRDLEAIRDAMADPYTQTVIEHQIRAIRGRMAALVDVMDFETGPRRDPAIHIYAARLERAMGAGVSTEMQAETVVKQGAPPVAP
jgi:hypothetical protein